MKIPKGRPNYNSDVETFHRLVEDEFYCVEEYFDRVDFLNSFYSYLLHFNITRIDTHRNNKAPLQILTESSTDIDPTVVSLPPIIFDYHSRLYLRKFNPSAVYQDS